MRLVDSGTKWIGLSVMAVLITTGMASGAEEWWLRSYYRETAPTNGFKTHVEVAGGGENLTGNESGMKATGRGLIALRRQMMTFYLDGSGNVENKDYGTLGSIQQTTYMLRETLRCDLGKRVYTSVGAVEERDDMTFIQARNGYFGGFGYDWSRSEALQVTTYGALGHDSVDYDVAQAGEFYDGAESESSPAAILSLGVVWYMQRQLSLRPNAMYVDYIGDELEDRWELGVALQYDLAPHMSLVLRYEERTEDNPVLESVGGDTKNTALKWMFRVSY